MRIKNVQGFETRRTFPEINNESSRDRGSVYPLSGEILDLQATVIRRLKQLCVPQHLLVRCDLTNYSQMSKSQHRSADQHPDHSERHRLGRDT